MRKYLDLCDKILQDGVYKDLARPGMPPTKSIHFQKLDFDLQEGFPLLTTKKMFIPGIIHELLWFMRGDTNIHYLLKNNVHIWDGDGYKFYCKNQKELECEIMSEEDWIESCKNDKQPYGKLGNIYGYQWRHANGVDQLKNLINNIVLNSNSRYHIVDAWNAKDYTDGEQALPACHMMFQVCIRDEYLDLGWFQRSNDFMLGNPFNFASYAILTHLLAKITGYKPGILTFFGGDIHIYDTQVETYLSEQKDREPFPLPTLNIDCVTSPDDYWIPRMGFDLDRWLNTLNIDMFKIENYQHHPAIKYELSVGI
jgi:thymidylate synthase